MIDKECIIICNFNEKEKKLIKAYASMIGIKEQIQVTWKNSQNTIKDIIVGNITENLDNAEIKDRAIIFNSLDSKKVSIFIDNMKKMRIAPAMKAVVTETSIEWTLNQLLKNLIEERKAEKAGKQFKH
ncbi:MULTISPECIES: DUF3783 domain-containing protein [Clostridium]|uniref:DUF3783 domain-containing protein n=1 Tax=Clostridium cibarium TaxID=2762247 RepID=A0ABR8PUA1_9CLOT|nr:MULTISPECIES: DUF3783 domain-containing protein [Clostridium]MBD7911695.1 DUF3783 domain-containing protein [Clostridium cibarium]